MSSYPGSMKGRSTGNTVPETGPAGRGAPGMTASKASQPADAAPAAQRRRRRPAVRSALTGRAFAESFGFASADLLFDLASLDLMFLAVRYQPGFGPLAIAYTVANIASALPITPGGLGVVEVTLVAIMVGFGAPRPTAGLSLVGYRIVNYWLALIPGTIAYIRLRLSPATAGRKE